MSATYGFKYWFGNPKLHIYKDKFFVKSVDLKTFQIKCFRLHYNNQIIKLLH